MRLVIDTNLLISALLVEHSAPARLLIAWRRGRFTLLTAELQIEELRRVSRYPKIRERLRTSLAGELVNQLGDLAVVVTDLPRVDLSPNPFDNFLLAIAQAGDADCLVSGDRRGLLDLGRFETCRIVTVQMLLAELR
ncbi:putative toxin-antitoxin system toxin component, PIN family [uncultured Thiodictyon sp.]|uniref:putative toxin-antitoxin system toxin component, PIN family n=1 Tax=uncultured Thiodictyon sp. TaxID=1846217 RepID=UPI002600F0D3|nr:putative toxin-antitoxin system toxin component, PIN family [uncultured Thiodictyon sp.]